MAYSFDKFFLHLPAIERMKDFTEFWKSSIDAVKAVPMEGTTLKRGSDRRKFSAFDISYRSFGKVTITGILYIPDETPAPKPVVVLHDYNRTDSFSGVELNQQHAYLFLNLRGYQQMGTTSPVRKSQTKEATTPGLMAENIADKKAIYARAAYLDCYRAIDFLRLARKLDCSSVGIIGRGFGASCAAFAAAFSNRVGSVVLESPALAWLHYSQNHSSGDISKEINQYLHANRSRRNETKTALSYFDILNFTDLISCPVMMSTGLKDGVNPSQAAFAFFNNLLTDKTAYVYPDYDDRGFGNESWKDAIAFTAEKLASS
jgi:cephalosporin-C deacetylase